MELVVGRIAKAHGITGEVVVEVRTDDPQSRFVPGRALRLRRPRDPAEREVTVESVRPHGGRLLVRLGGVADRDAAERLRGGLFVVQSADLPPLADPDEFSEVLHTAGGELLSVRTTSGAELLVPFVAAIVASVSLQDRCIEIDPPPGLLELGS